MSVTVAISVSDLLNVLPEGFAATGEMVVEQAQLALAQGNYSDLRGGEYVSIDSDTEQYPHRVTTFSGIALACTCADFRYRERHAGDPCKHMQRANIQTDESFEKVYEDLLTKS